MTTYYVDGAVGNNLNAGTSPGSGNAWATIDHALATATGASDVVYVKASATYTISSSLTYPSGRNDIGSAAPYSIIGYTATPGDGGQPTITTSSAIAIWTLAGNNVLLANFILAGNNIATYGVNVTAGSPERGLRLLNLTVNGGVTSYGIYSGGNPFAARKILITGMKSGAVGGWYGAGWISESAFVGNACSGVSFNGNNAGMLFVARSVFANNTGVGSCGLYLENALQGCVLDGCAIYGNASDGIAFAGSFAVVSVFNSIIALNGGYGLNCAFSTGVANDFLNGNALYANTSGNYHNVTAGANDIVAPTMTGQPFANPTGTATSLSDVWTNFALNSTAGAGATCKGAAGIGGLDLGAVQSSGGGGGTTNIIVNKMTTTYLVDEGAI